MRYLSCLAVFAVLLPFTAFASDFPFSKRAEYSADISYNMAGHQGVGRVYQSKEADRREMTVSGQRSVIIMKDDEVLMMMPDMGMAMRMPHGSDPVGMAYDPDESMKFNAVGTETVNGEKTTKYLAESEDGTGHFWVTEDGILMRVEMQTDDGTMTINTTNVKRGAQPATLFELPAGVRIMDMGGFGQVGGKGLNPFQTR